MRNAGVIFDIDGTLVDSTEFEGRLYVAAVLEVLGRVLIRSNWGD
jgi:beta-phosphoglucomutase-like phosphatase (HAD superfamily)